MIKSDIVESTYSRIGCLGLSVRIVVVEQALPPITCECRPILDIHRREINLTVRRANYAHELRASVAFAAHNKHFKLLSPCAYRDTHTRSSTHRQSIEYYNRICYRTTSLPTDSNGGAAMTVCNLLRSWLMFGEDPECSCCAEIVRASPKQN